MIEEFNRIRKEESKVINFNNSEGGGREENINFVKLVKKVIERKKKW